MLKPIRKTATGLVEYWDTKNKVIVLSSSQVSKDVVDLNTEIDLDVMDADQLRSFAEQNGIDIPGNMKKEETIRNYISEELKAAADAE